MLPGSGKALMAIAALKKMASRMPRKPVRVLLVVPSISGTLLQQWEETFGRVPEEGGVRTCVGLFRGPKAAKGAPEELGSIAMMEPGLYVTLKTPQTMRAHKDQLRKVRYEFVVVDEAQWCANRSPKNAAEEVGKEKKNYAALNDIAKSAAALSPCGRRSRKP